MKSLFTLLFMLALLNVPLYADETDTSQNSAPQNIGGLLFDVDEGVKLEQGPGGSVYVRSNKEYMSKKIRAIERKLVELEGRISALESTKGDDDSKVKDEDIEGSEFVGRTADGRRVLST